MSKRFLFSLLVCAAFLSSLNPADAAPKSANCLILAGRGLAPPRPTEDGSSDGNAPIWHLAGEKHANFPLFDPNQLAREQSRQSLDDRSVLTHDFSAFGP